MKALYAFFQSDNTNLPAGEKELFTSIDKVYEVYLYYLSFIIELRDFVENFIEERKQKFIPTEEDLNPKLNFVNNRLISLLAKSHALHQECKKHKILWSDQQDLFRKIYFDFRNEKTYRDYLEKKEPEFDDDRDILIFLFAEFIFPSEIIIQFFEEKSIYWLDDIGIMQKGVLKTLRSLKQEGIEEIKLLPLIKEADEDRKFASDLFRKTILHSNFYDSEIASRAQNWEIERVAKMDMILMKMAICELTEFPSIPVKVTLDEYIELSKDYSSPQSKTFINGILDKLLIDYRRENKIQKAGRGLIE